MEKYIYENTRRYLSSQDSLVILNEYMFFKDKESQEKFIVLQFENNFEETIYAFKIELTQLNHESKAIRKAEYEFNNLNVDANKNFVPFGKIAVDKACESIDVNLIYVRAETGELVNGKWEIFEVEQEEELMEEKIVIQDNEDDEDVLENIRNNKKVKNKVKRLKLSKRGLYFPLRVSLFMVLILIVASVLSFQLYHKTRIQNAGGEFSYEELASGEISITKYHGTSKEVVIPSQIDDKLVISISPRAFMDTLIESVTIEAKNISISHHAFADCIYLGHVSGLTATTINGYAFKDCINLQEVEFDSINLIIPTAFYGCEKLEDY